MLFVNSGEGMVVETDSSDFDQLSDKEKITYLFNNRQFGEIPDESFDKGVYIKLLAQNNLTAQTIGVEPFVTTNDFLVEKVYPSLNMVVVKNRGHTPVGILNLSNVPESVSELEQGLIVRATLPNFYVHNQAGSMQDIIAKMKNRTIGESFFVYRPSMKEERPYRLEILATGKVYSHPYPNLKR